MSADAHGAVRYQDVLGRLRVSYDGRAAWRDQQEKTPWKLAERELFLGRVLGDGGGRMLEIGAGPGHDSAYFASHGLRMVATDLSPAMVGFCRQKGLMRRHVGRSAGAARGAPRVRRAELPCI